jgi:phosphopantothenoylcysteine decarboxylase/phosphopantothenate--cysteine ligase
MTRPLHVLISAGPTQEPIDPVRFISNHSSGKMGYAIARAAMAAGHRVTLVSGPVALKPPRGCRVIAVRTAAQMRRALLAEFRRANVIFQVAAVADYRPKTVHRRKIKKSATTLTLRLLRNPDILATMGARKGCGQVLVGFAAETHTPTRYGRDKLRSKNLDFIVVNDVSKPGIGFESEHNAVVVISRDGQLVRLPRQPKLQLARRLLRIVMSRRSRLEYFRNHPETPSS